MLSTVTDPGADPMLEPKVICIGMNKTGTSTLKHCFEQLRLNPVASPRNYSPEARRQIRHFYQHKNYDAMLRLAEAYRSFEDRPWNMWSMYRHLNERFPDSLFILTVRDPESWWRSTERWLTVTKPEVLPNYQLHLRVDQPSSESMIESYLRYNEEVCRYFAGSGRLLVMDVEKGDGWDKLCRFLGMPSPDVDFPHANRQHYSVEDARMLKERRRLKNGVVCQACEHITVPRKKTGKASLRRRDGGVGRTRRLFQELRARLDPESLQNSALARHALYGTHRALKLMPPWRPHRLPQGAGSALAPDEFAVVSCLFNPGNSPRRVENFRRFLAGMRDSGVRCVAVELAFGSNPFRIDDHDEVIRLRSDSVLWHKERLLNIAIRRLLEEGVRKIAWLDGDIVFEQAHWPLEIAARLEHANLCQVFDSISIHAHPSGPPMVSPSAVRYFRESGELFNQHPRKPMNLLRGMLKGGQSGFGWAARAEVLQQSLLFEHAVVGGGDKLILAAALAGDQLAPRFGELTLSKVACEACGHRNRSTAYSEDFQRWAAGWSHAVAGSVDYARLHIHDMYHGMRTDRGYVTRHDILFRHGFDPEQDLQSSPSGVLEWAPGRRDLQREVEAYFLSRREDI